MGKPIDVPPGHIAAVITHLEMRARPKAQPLPDAPFSLKRWPAPSVERYRALFQRVGGPWLWYSRMEMADDALTAILHDPMVEIYAVVGVRSIEVGMVEIDFRQSPLAEIAFFGLIPELAGKGHGRWLMAQTLGMAWRSGVERLHLTTCTLDHPAALGFYRKAGFTATHQQIEIHPDPRLHGVLPPEAAPQIPIFQGDGSAKD